MTTQAISNWESEFQHRRTTLLSNLLLAATVGGLIALVLAYVSLPEGMSVAERSIEMAPFLAGWLVVLIIWSWRGMGYRTRAWIMLLLAYSLGIFIFRRGGLPGSGRVWLLILPALAFLLVGLRSGIVAGAASILTYVIFALAFSQKWLVPLVAEDPAALGTWLSEGGSFLLMTASLTLILSASSQGWMDALAGASKVNRQLQAQRRELEETNERLHRQTSQLQATAEIAQAGSSILDLEKLQVEVVNQIQEGFSPMGVYYVGLFLLDEAQQFAVLAAATGEAGQLLLEMGYKLELSETSTIGWCITHRQPRITLNEEEDTVQFDALPMPHTRSEIALPLRSRGHILGALSVQSTQETAFSEADIAVLQTMADQVAVAIDNARLFSQTEAVLEEVQMIQRRYLVQTWREFLATRPAAQIDYTQSGAEPGDRESLRKARRAAMVHERTVAIASSSPGFERETSMSPHATLIVPLKLRGHVIGTMALQETGQQRSWTAEEITLAETVAEQVALTVETLRLMDETQRQAAHEQLVSEISGRVWASLNPDTILKTTVRELGRALGTELASIQITGPGRDDGGSPGEEPTHEEEE